MFKLRHLMILLGLLIATKTQAQLDSNTYIGMSFGLSTPTGSLAKFGSLGTSGDLLPGYADFGNEFNFVGAYHFSKHVGIGTRLGFHNYWANEDQFRQANRNLDIRFESRPDYTYSCISFGTGLRFRGKVLKHLEVFLMPYTGVANFSASTQQFQILNTTTNRYDNVSILNRYNTAMMYGLNGGFRTTGRFGMLVEFNIVNLGTLEVNDNYNNTRLQSIGWVSLNLGVFLGLY